MFEPIEKYPQYKNFFDTIVANYDTFRKDCQSVLDNNETIKWPEEEIYDGRWDVYPFIWQDKIHKSSQHLESMNVLLNYREQILNCGFSITYPGCRIHTHRGYTSKVLRCHLGLIIPKDSCFIQVEKETKEWKENEILFFDDTKKHSSWNYSNEIRVVLLTDLIK